MIEFEKRIQHLKEYFLREPLVAMTYVFGSYAKGRQMSESDFDIAVYYRPENNQVEYEEEKKYPEEDKLWSDVEKIVHRETDFIVLNRAPATLAFEILKTGRAIIIKDEGLWLDFYLVVSGVAEDFREFIKDYWAIKQRSGSLNRNR